MKDLNFLLIGSGGYIAPRHVKAIKDIGGRLVGCVDINFSEKAIEMLPKDIITASSINEFLSIYQGKVDYVVICSPNFLHEEHIKEGLTLNADIISEKPVALTTEGINNLISAESSSQGSINTILQLRLHPVMKELEDYVSNAKKSNHQIDLKYIAKRDDSYFQSWKGDLSLSGGLLLNVGVHYFDLLLNVFGDEQGINLEDHTNKRSKGTLELERATVNWLFSFEQIDIDQFVPQGQSAFRIITVDGNEIVFSNVAEDLHTESYKRIITGKPFGIHEARRSIDLVDKINNISI